MEVLHNNSRHALFQYKACVQRAAVLHPVDAVEPSSQDGQPGTEMPAAAGLEDVNVWFEIDGDKVTACCRVNGFF